MSLIGKDGIIQLARSYPDPIVLPPSALDIANSRFTINSTAFWPGDEVILIHSGGTKTGFVWRDTLDRITLHSTAVGAQDNTISTRISLSGIPSTATILCLKGTTNATSVLTALHPSLTNITTEVTLLAYPTANSSYIAANTGTTLWNIQGHIKKWSLKLGSNTTDTGSLGEKFGDSIKATISGSGTFDFLVDFLENSNNTNDIDIILRMALMVENDAIAQAKLYLKKRTAVKTVNIQDTTVAYLPGSVYYQTSMLLVDTSLDTNPDDFIKGSVNFVTTGPVRLFRE
jgi:hypothetical protein